MLAFGRQASAGIAVHVQTSANAKMERHVAMDRCYMWQEL